METLLNCAEKVMDKAGKSRVIKFPISLFDLMPNNRDEYFRYIGSLTSPDCDETVIWTIFSESVPISHSQVMIFFYRRNFLRLLGY